MTLEDLRTYHRLREYQISHLINARKCHEHGGAGEHQMYIFLLFWADAKHEADQMQRKPGYLDAVVYKANGRERMP